MFELTTMTEAQVASVTNRIEKHGEDDMPAVSIGLAITGSNTLLDLIDPTIRHCLYKAIEDQEQLPGVEETTPVLRCNSFKKHHLTTEYEGWTLAVDDGIDETTPMVFGGVKVDKFVIEEAMQGGSIVLKLRAGTNDVDADKLGKLAMHNGQTIWITLKAPERQPDAIDGSVGAFQADHPDATDLFVAGEGGDSEGGEPDASPDPAPAKTKGKRKPVEA